MPFLILRPGAICYSDGKCDTNSKTWWFDSIDVCSYASNQHRGIGIVNRCSVYAFTGVTRREAVPDLPARLFGGAGGINFLTRDTPLFL